MSERTSQVVRIGQLKGAKIKIKEIKNDGLQEYITIVNRGTLAQPMSGWVLASLRGQAFYPFADGLLLEAGMIVKIQSGQLEPNAAQAERSALKTLLWTIGQVWNNQGDTAV
ncbi:MAG: lamin tail domain-containing protein, partial [Chloroflexi bacterium]|nr:lamin tail domain-containing protein [Chloroflexota bacterium]